jgi:hypothetical protein
VNLYKGERHVFFSIYSSIAQHLDRFVNTDYALSNAYKNMGGLEEIIVSYDIACQYSINWEERFHKSPFLAQPGPEVFFLIPKFHLLCHKDKCRYEYSFRYNKRVGWTDGEAIERFWSPHNHLSSSTSKMAAGFRLDTLNMHFADWNLRKTRKMGTFLYYSLDGV